MWIVEADNIRSASSGNDTPQLRAVDLRTHGFRSLSTVRWNTPEVLQAVRPASLFRASRLTKLSPADLCYPLPDSLDLVYGAMMEPLSVAVHAVATVGSLRTGQNVLIFGAGPVGLLAMGVAKGLGAAKIIAVDINEERLNFAKSYAATDIYVPVSDITP